MAKIKTLPDADIALLARMIDRERKRPLNNAPEPEPVIPPSSSNVFILKTPATGIDAINGPVPGFADCAVYKIVPVGSSYNLVAVPNLKKRCFNLSGSKVSGDKYIVALQDRFGCWPVIFEGCS